MWKATQIHNSSNSEPKHFHDNYIFIEINIMKMFMFGVTIVVYFIKRVRLGILRLSYAVILYECPMLKSDTFHTQIQEQ